MAVQPGCFVLKACGDGLAHFNFSVDREQHKACLTRSSWLNCALRDDEAVYWVSIGHYEAVAVSN